MEIKGRRHVHKVFHGITEQLIAFLTNRLQIICTSVFLRYLKKLLYVCNNQFTKYSRKKCRQGERTPERQDSKLKPHSSRKTTCHIHHARIRLYSTQIVNVSFWDSSSTPKMNDVFSSRDAVGSFTTEHFWESFTSWSFWGSK